MTLLESLKEDHRNEVVIDNVYHIYIEGLNDLEDEEVKSILVEIMDFDGNVLQSEDLNVNESLEEVVKNCKKIVNINNTEVIEKIYTRLLKWFEDYNFTGLDHPYEKDKLTFVMDIESLYNQFKINLNTLLESDEVTFIHDIGGMYKGMDRSTYPGKITDLFMPRCARGE